MSGGNESYYANAAREKAFKNREADGTERTLAISGGFANVSGDGATILAEAAEFGDEIDIERAQIALARAFMRLRVSGVE